VGASSKEPTSNTLTGRLKTAFGHNAADNQGASEILDEEKNKEIETLMEKGDEDEIEDKVADINSKPDQKEASDKAERKKWWRFLQHFLIQKETERALARIQEIIEFHQAQMDILAEMIKLARNSLNELDEQRQALMREIQRFRETGQFDIDETTGQFKNAKAKEALTDWEEKTGRKIDLSDPSSYLDVMEAAADLEAQEAEIKETMERDERDYEYHKTKRDEALEIKSDLESGDPERCKLALQRLENLDSNQRAFRVENALTSESKIDSSQKKVFLQQMNLTEEDLALDGFSFNFPPLQASFTDAAKGIEGDTIRAGVEPQKQEQKAAIFSPVMK